MQNRQADPPHSGATKNWAQLKPEILSAIKNDAQPAVFIALLAEVRKMMEQLKRSNQLDAFSV